MLYFSPESKNLFKNLKQPKFVLITIIFFYVRTCLGKLEKCRLLLAGFYCSMLKSIGQLTVIPRALSQQPRRPKAEWAIDSKAMRARGIIVLVKPSQLVKNIETKELKLAKRDSPSRHCFSFQSRRFSLLVGYNIQPSSSSTNQNIALMIDHQVDFTNIWYTVYAICYTLHHAIHDTLYILYVCLIHKKMQNVCIPHQ